MMQSPEAFRYIGYLRSRWRFVAASAGTAIVLATTVSLFLPRQYTATARILIEPPAGADPRAALAVSPIYLESLKTYERFADSYTLFQKAVERFRLRSLVGSSPIESLKKKVLKIELVHNTRILEISATLPDPGRAQGLAQFMAEETTALNRSLTNSGGQDLVHGVEQQVTDARARLNQTEGEWSKLIAEAPVSDLEAAIEQAGRLRSSLEEQVATANVQLADEADRERGAQPSELDLLRKEQSNTRARQAELRKQIEAVVHETGEKEKLLAGRLARREQLDAQRKSDQAALAAIDARLRDTRSDLSYRGERLTIIDPGVVPERPSSPNLPLNVAAALLLGLLFPLVWLALELNFQEQRVLHALAHRD
jgi:uncharacterized protein involved in exopolysaccharide biosynthesis